MNRQNAVLFFASLFILSILVGCNNTFLPTKSSTPLITDQEEFTRQIDIPPNLKILEIHHISGDITIVGWEKPYILVEGIKRASAETVQIARSILEMVDIIAYERPTNRLVMEYEGPAGFARKNVPEEGMSYTANVPRELLLDIKTKNASLQVSNMLNDVIINHKNGDIRIDSIGGNVTIDAVGHKKANQQIKIKSIENRLKLKSGHVAVELENINGAVDIEHQYGELRASNINANLSYSGKKSSVFMNRIQGFLQIKSLSGDIVCDGFYDGMRAEVHNGTLKMEPRVTIKRSIECKVDHGNITLRVADDCSMLLDIVAENGSINSEFPLPVSAEGKYSYAKGAINKGYPMVRLEVKKGSASILKEIPIPGDAATSQPYQPETENVTPITDIQSTPIIQ